jgi:hypothetical protein
MRTPSPMQRFLSTPENNIRNILLLDPRASAVFGNRKELRLNPTAAKLWRAETIRAHRSPVMSGPLHGTSCIWPILPAAPFGAT